MYSCLLLYTYGIRLSLQGTEERVTLPLYSPRLCYWARLPVPDQNSCPRLSHPARPCVQLFVIVHVRLNVRGSKNCILVHLQKKSHIIKKKYFCTTIGGAADPPTGFPVRPAAGILATCTNVHKINCLVDTTCVHRMALYHKC